MFASSENNLPTLYLIPNFIGNTSWVTQFPDINKSIICQLKYFIAEDARACRQLLKLAGYKDISSAIIEEYNEHHFDKDISHLLQPLHQGHSIGLVSEAGMPVIADPGDVIVRMAHQKNFNIVPLVGASSIMLAVVASGLSGNNFAFIGYLPIEAHDRVRRIKEIEQFSFTKRQAQFFIEAPYRNQKLFSLLIQILNSDTLLVIACNLMETKPLIKTKPVSEWKKSDLPDIQKKPCVFGIMKV